MDRRPTPTCRDFCPRDVRHSLADIGKAQRLLGYAPTHRIAQGLALALALYAFALSSRRKE